MTADPPTHSPNEDPGDLSPWLGDQAARWGAGERPAIEDYLAHHPDLLNDSEAILDLIIHEVVLREDRGERPEPDEYAIRFPKLADAIRLQFRVDELVRNPVSTNSQEASRTNDVTDLGLSVTLNSPSGMGEAAWRRLPGYEILGLLGRGGMGVVYQARHLGLNRVVAVKMIVEPALADPARRARFMAEAEAIASLQHPHIVQIFEVGRSKELPYFALEYCPGGTLAEMVKGGRMPPREAAVLLESLARGLAYAHDRNIVHRDIKPENILLAEGGVPKISDFGLAKRLGDEAGMTRTESIMGTPSYMAPEQAEGRSKDVGPAADIYGLGGILYRLLVGRPPFTGESTQAVIRQVIHDEPEMPRRFEPEVPRDLETVCLKCLEKHPQQRYASAEMLAEDLRRFLEGRPIHARPVRAPERAAKWARRNPIVAALLSLLLASLLLGLTGTLTYAYREGLKASEARIAATDAKDQAIEAKKSQHRAERAAHSSGLNFYAAGMNLADIALRGENLELPLHHLDSLRPRTDFEDFRGFEWHELRRRLGDPAAVTDSVPETENIVSGLFSRDGKWLAVVTETKGVPTLRLLDATDRSLKSVSPAPPLKDEMLSNSTNASGNWSHMFRARISPDSRWLAVGSRRGGIWLWSLEDGAFRWTCPRGTLGNLWVTDLVFSPDGQTLSVAILGGLVNGQFNEFAIQPFDSTSGRPLEAIRLPKEEINRARALSYTGTFEGISSYPDGRLISAGTGNILRIWNPKTRAVVDSIEMGDRPQITGVEVSEDGQWLAAFGVAGRLEVRRAMPPYDLVFRSSSQGSGIVVAAAFHPRLPVVAFLDQQGVIRTYWIFGERPPDLSIEAWRFWPSQGELLKTILTPPSNWGQISFSRDGRLLASRGVGRSIHLWDDLSGGPVRRFRADGQSLLHSVTYSPDGTMLAYTDYSSRGGCRVVLCESETRLPIWISLPYAAARANLAYGPDGQIAVVDQDGTILLWDSHNGRVLPPIRGLRGNIERLIFSPDARHLTIEAFDLDASRRTDSGRGRILYLWDLRSGRLAATASPAETAASFNRGGLTRNHGYAFIKGGNAMVVSSGFAAAVIDLATRKTIRALSGVPPSLDDIEVSADGRYLAGTSLQKVLVWDLAEESPHPIILQGHVTDVRVLAFSPEGRRLATGGNDHTVKIWDLESGQELRTLTGHHDWIHSLAFSPDGRWLASAGRDEHIQFWDGGDLDRQDQAKREALGVLETSMLPGPHCLRFGAAETMRQRVSADAGLTQSVRRAALDLIDRVVEQTRARDGTESRRGR